MFQVFRLNFLLTSLICYLPDSIKPEPKLAPPNRGGGTHKGTPSRHVGLPHTMSQNVQSGFWGKNWTSEGLKTFFLFFFWSSPDVWGKLDVGRRGDLFYFLVFTRCLGENWTSGPRKMISWGGTHCLSAFPNGTTSKLAGLFSTLSLYNAERQARKL